MSLAAAGFSEQMLIDFKYLERIQDLAKEKLVEAGFPAEFTALKGYRPPSRKGHGMSHVTWWLNMVNYEHVVRSLFSISTACQDCQDCQGT